MKKTVAFYTLGCKVNQYETNAMEQQFIKKGYEVVDNTEKANILLDAGMHCLGCPASQAETLEEACEVHGIEVEELLNELNK